MNNVTILGGGVLGTQIAFQCAYTGKNVTIWLRSEDSKTRTIPKLENLKETLKGQDRLDAEDLLCRTALEGIYNYHVKKEAGKNE